MSNLLDEKWLENLPEPIVDNMSKLNAEVIKVICERIKYFGDLRPTEIKKLTNSLEFLGGDMKTIERIVRKYTNLSNKEIEDIFEDAATQNDEFAKRYYQYRGIDPVTHTNNEYLQNILKAITDATIGNMSNLSDTYGFKFPGQKAMPLRRTYTRVIDRAIYEVQTGVTDFNTAMRKFVKELSDSGVRIVEWDSGYSRRVDSAVRMNILDGVKRLNQEMMLYNGEQYGSDGIELSAHALSAPDHLPVQGHQFSNAEFNNMQSGLSCVDVDGNVYEGFERPIGEWSCRHFAFPIVIGVSAPTYTDKQLRNMQKNSVEKYGATQKMRQLETNLRKLKERRMAFSAAGNELDAIRTQREINLKTKEYNKFCTDNQLSPQSERARVDGYKNIPIKNKSLTEGKNNGIINLRGEGKVDLKIDEFTPCLKDAKTGEIVQTAFELVNQEDLKSVKDWKFNWNDRLLRNTEIYKLTLKGKSEIQGLISLTDEKKDSAIHINIAESAPDNFGRNKRYEGVGGHLFAIAVQKSVERGYGGFVFMEAKNESLVKYYSEKLGAILIGGVHPYRMIIDEESANKLLKIYTLEEELQ